MEQATPSVPPSGHPPEQVCKLPGSIWAVTAYFNPAGYCNRVPNYRIFRERLRPQNIPLLAVEAAVDDASFELQPEDADQLVQRRCHSILWQKERLFNLALDLLPDDCDKVVFLDADLIATDDGWAAKTAALLERFVAVQPFQDLIELPRRSSVLAPGAIPERTGFSSASTWCNCHHPSSYIMRGGPGGAMALRRSFIERHRFYDREILGSADSAFFGALVGMRPSRNHFLFRYTSAFLRHMDSWADPIIREARGSVSYLPITFHHLWHGNRSMRYYEERMSLASDYDPATDVHVAESGCLEWCSDKPDLHARIRNYFFARREAGERAATVEDLRLQTLTESLEREKERAKAFFLQKMETEQEIGILRHELQTLQRQAQESKEQESTITHRLAQRMDAWSLWLLPRGSRRRATVVRWAKKMVG